MKNNQEFEEVKKAAFEHCMDYASGRIGRLLHQIKEIENGLTSETKSSAGDKHETGRAMLQLEREKLGAQLAEAERMLEVMGKVNPASAYKTVGLGALVVTSSAMYYIAISAGEFKHKTKTIYCISVATPIGKLLLGKEIGETFQFHEKKHEILIIS